MVESGRARSNSSNNPNQAHLLQTFKIVIIGEKGVGKTSMVHRYTEDKFDESTESTIGAQFSTKIVDFLIPNTLIAGRHTSSIMPVQASPNPS